MPFNLSGNVKYCPTLLRTNDTCPNLSGVQQNECQTLHERTMLTKLIDTRIDIRRR